jgi:L-fuculose-phosphate aldolase
MAVSEFQARRDVVEIGRRIWQRGYVAANDGNLSVRVAPDRIVVTPTGRSKGFLRPDELVVVDMEGKKRSGTLEPTSELPMHIFAYTSRPDIEAVVHAHPPRATGFAVAGVALAQCVLPEVILTLGKVPLTEYATPSTTEVPTSIEAFIGKYNAILLRNHGVLTLGATVEEAYFRMETVEHFAEITLAAMTLGGASPLSREDVRKLLEVREKLGIPSAGSGCYGCGACDETAAARSAAAADGVDGSRGSPHQPPATAEGDVPATGATPCGDSDEDVIRAVLTRVEKALGDPGRIGESREGDDR